MKKLFALILVCAALLAAAMPIGAAKAESPVQPRYTYIDNLRADLEISGLGVASCCGTFSVKEYIPVKIVIRLQQLDGSNWMTVKKWEISGTGSVTATKSYAVYSGFSYRVHVTGYVYDADGNILEYDSASRYMDY